MFKYKFLTLVNFTFQETNKLFPEIFILLEYKFFFGTGMFLLFFRRP